MLKRGNAGVWGLVQRDMKLAALGSVVALIAAVPVVHAARMSNFEQSGASSAQASSDDWCREDSRELSRDRERVCEVRTFTLAAPKIVDAEAANGSLSVTGTSRRDVRILAKVVAEARSKSQATSIAADVKITTADGRVRADGPRLEQVFVNLIQNAAHALATRPGPRTLAVRSRVTGGKVTLEFADNGPGISPEAVGKIFEPFFTTKDPGLGTGLGLTVARDIVADQGGSLQVESTVGVGTTFRVILPL